MQTINGNPTLSKRVSGTVVSGNTKCYETIRDRNLDPNPVTFAIVKDNGAGSGVYQRIDKDWFPIFENPKKDVALIWDETTFSSNENGYMKLPNNMLFQWGVTNDIILAGGEYKEYHILFPISFVKALRNITVSVEGIPSVSASYSEGTICSVVLKVLNNSMETQTVKLSYQAIGY